MRKSNKVLIGVAVLTMALAGCSTKAPTTETTGGTALESTDGGATERVAESDIVIAVDSTFVTMDPADATMTLDGSVQKFIMDGLFGFDKDMKVINMLATGYEANDDATEFTFTLREGISFTDGVAWNAEAAMANLNRLADQTLGLKRNGLFAMIDTTEKIDDYTIKVNLKYSFGAFINTLAHPAGVMMSPTQIEAGPEVCASQPVGTGQYIFDEWRPGEYLRIKLNEDWWGYDAELCGGEPLAAANAGFSTVTLKPVTESATRVSMVQTGDADFLFKVPSESFSVLEADPNVTAEKKEGGITWYMYLNTQKEALSDVRVRQAINMAVDKEAYCLVVKNGLSFPSTSHMAPSVQFYKEQPAVAYDVEAAKALLAEAGYGDGLTLTAISGNSSENIKWGEFTQQQLAQIGITLNLEPLETATLNERVEGSGAGTGKDAAYDIILRGWSTSTGDADWLIRAIFSYTLRPPMGSSYTYYQNDEYEAAVQAGLDTADPEARAVAYAKAQDILWEEVPAVAMGVDYNLYAYGKHVQGISRYADGGLYIREGVYIK